MNIKINKKTLHIQSINEINGSCIVLEPSAEASKLETPELNLHQIPQENARTSRGRRESKTTRGH